jgi:MFS family permease
MRYNLQLDSLNFLLEDVHGGLIPYIGMFLLIQAHLDPATIGAVLTISALIGISVYIPLGVFIDATSFKRGLLLVGIALLTGSAVAIAQAPTVPVVMVAIIVMAVVGAIFAPTVAAITLGLTEPHGWARRLGRNAAWDRTGNLFVAGMTGLVGWSFGQGVVFARVPLFALLTAGMVMTIPARMIDHARARGLTEPMERPAADHRPSSWRVLLERRPLLVLAAATALFHFANTPMLALVGQKLALANPGAETALMSACIVTAQLVMIAMALLVSAKADAWGRKPLVLAAATALAMRGVLFAVSDNPAWLVGGQLLDGIGFGLFEALLPLMLADVMRGTGRYNVSRGVVGTVQGIGGALSNAIAGLVVVSAGYSAAFLLLAMVALAALGLITLALQETRGAVSS